MYPYLSQSCVLGMQYSDWPGQSHIFTLETEEKSAHLLLTDRVKEIKKIKKKKGRLMLGRLNSTCPLKEVIKIAAALFLLL